MNIVYKLIFKNRKKAGILPFMYIGSKSNVTVNEGVMYDIRGNPYYGSSTWANWNDIVNNDDVELEIIKTFDNYTDALNYESIIQKSLDVVADPIYFNLAIATVNNFTDPNYATYKHMTTGKTVRLPRDHEKVLTGEYVGVTYGRKFSEEEKRARPDISGKNNPFYGKKHTQETKEKISKSKIGKKPPPSQIENWVEKVAKLPKTEEHKSKIGRKGLIVLKNINTGECIRISKESRKEYNESIWMNPYKISRMEKNKK